MIKITNIVALLLLASLAGHAGAAPAPAAEADAVVEEAMGTAEIGYAPMPDDLGGGDDAYDVPGDGTLQDTADKIRDNQNRVNDVIDDMDADNAPQ
jgi:hypothetical protein